MPNNPGFDDDFDTVEGKDTHTLFVEMTLSMRMLREDWRDFSRRMSANFASLQQAMHAHGTQIAAHTQELIALRRDQTRHSDEFKRIHADDETGAIKIGAVEKEVSKVKQTWRTVRVVAAVVAFVVSSALAVWALMKKG